MPKLDTALLQAALFGLESERDRIEAAMSAIRRQLGGRSSVYAAGNGAQPKHTMSEAGRRAIALAQKKRWAAVHKAAKKAAPKRKMSPAAKAKLVANLAKARAARAAKRAATA